MNKEDLSKMIQEKKVTFKILANGGFGAGKTYFAMTFPKWAYAMIEPNGILTAASNPHLKENMVDAEFFTPKDDEDIKVTFERLGKYVDQCRVWAKEGKIETFILDNLSHLSQARWMYIEKYEKSTTKSGATDTLAMYGALNRWLSRFILTEVVTLPCNVVVPVHEMEEEERDEATGKSSKTGRTITNTLGGFRNDAAGFFNASIFLEAKKVGDKMKYTAQCLPSFKKPAKNNIGLPEMVENISYGALVNAVHTVNKTA